MAQKKEIVYKTEEQLKQETRLRDLAEAALAKPKSGTEKKLENYWYHYKWHTIAAGCCLILAILFIKDMVFREKPDATIIIVAGEYIDDARTDALSQDLEQLTYDFNGDKKIIIDTNLIAIALDEENPYMAQEDYANAMKLTTIIAASTDPIYLLDNAAYKHIIRMGRDEDDPEDMDNVFIPQSVPADDFGFPGMRFYLRQASDGDDYYEYCKDLLRQLGNQ